MNDDFDNSRDDKAILAKLMGKTYPQAQYGSGAPHVKGRRFQATGEYRGPRKGEWFLSGAPIEAYYMPADSARPNYIAVPIIRDFCPTCGQERKS